MYILYIIYNTLYIYYIIYCILCIYIPGMRVLLPGCNRGCMNLYTWRDFASQYFTWQFCHLFATFLGIRDLRNPKTSKVIQLVTWGIESSHLTLNHLILLIWFAEKQQCVLSHIPSGKLTWLAGISPYWIGNTSSIRVHFPASYVRLPECNIPWDPWDWYIYLHENHNKSTIHAGKYTVHSHGSYYGYIYKTVPFFLPSWKLISGFLLFHL